MEVHSQSCQSQAAVRMTRGVKALGELPKGQLPHMSAVRQIKVNFPRHANVLGLHYFQFFHLKEEFIMTFMSHNLKFPR